MSFPHILVIISAFISFAGSLAYIRDTLAGRTKPNRVSWFLWAFAPLVGTGAALSVGADLWATSRIFFSGFLPVVVFIVSFTNKQSYWRLTMFDFFCGVCSVLALIVWGVIDAPRSAILLAALGDGFATLPTVVKAWKYPETETGLTYVASFVSVILIIPSIPAWNIENAAFQTYLLAANTSLVFAVYRKQVWSFVKGGASV